VARFDSEDRVVDFLTGKPEEVDNAAWLTHIDGQLYFKAQGLMAPLQYAVSTDDMRRVSFRL
jgi:hypothetical protein